jgi:hypothetical protein
MPTVLQLRRGTTAQNDAFTGAVGELSLDTQKDVLRVHDGSTAGGAQELVGLTATQTLTNKTLTSPTITGSGDIAANDLTLAGNLTVNGTTTTVASTNTTISDNLLELNSGAGSNANDSGILIERGSTGDNAIMAWDESADKFIVGTTTATNTSTGNLTITTGTLVANVEGNVTGNVTGNCSGTSGSTTGNAATATALATARNIGGVSFDGTGNINLPGVNTAGNQDTSGTAAIATTVTVADESSDTSCNVIFTTAATGDLAPKSGTNLTFNSSSGLLTATGFAGALTGDVTGNADTATTLETARNIAGVSFDGSANISLALTNLGISDGTNGQFLQTNGSGTFSFATVSTPTLSSLSLDTTDDVQFDSFGVGTAASGTTGEIRATNDVTAFYSSDVALKEDITNISNPLEAVDKLNGVLFNWKQSYIDQRGGEDGYFVRKKDVGVIAQDVEKVLPEAVATRPDGVKAVKYDRLTCLLIEAVKALKLEIEELKK